MGYSVINYILEDQVLQNLVGQMGHKVGVEVIATFLPRVVVDSLFAALRKQAWRLKVSPWSLLRH